MKPEGPDHDLLRLPEQEEEPAGEGELGGEQQPEADDDRIESKGQEGDGVPRGIHDRGGQVEAWYGLSPGGYLRPLWVQDVHPVQQVDGDDDPHGDP